MRGFGGVLGGEVRAVNPVLSVERWLSLFELSLGFRISINF